jgi:isoleucyl-tRNA synthetase
MVSTLLYDDETQANLGLKKRGYPHPFRTCIVLGHVTDPSGKKESKSKGNYTAPEVIFDRVAADFAVVTPEVAGLDVAEGEILLAREDMEALDLLPGVSLKVFRPGEGSAGPEALLALKQAKRLPRRLAVVSEADQRRLGVTASPKGLKIAPNDVPRLPAAERLTVESPTGSAPGADAFRWFFLAGNPPWSPTRHSLGNVRALQKEFPLKLRNVYSFFTIYANIDGFDPAARPARPVEKRPLLDRWILSELALVTGRVTEFMDNYRAYEAASQLNEFVDGLSNWYLRRSRVRYWKAEFDDDKSDAYSTLYECIVTVAQLAAAFVPFMSEEIYQNLVRRVNGSAPESVHLTDLPRTEEGRIDRSLSEEMAIVRNVVSLGLRVRTDHNLKVRQPLARAEVVLPGEEMRAKLEPYSYLIAEELNVHEVAFVRGGEEHVRYVVRPNYRRLGPRLGKAMPLAKKAFEQVDAASLRLELLNQGSASISIDGASLGLEPEDVEIAVEATGHFAAAGDKTTVVVLDTNLDDGLRDEGFYRELLHRVQNLRKELNVDYTERIRLSISGSDRLRRVLSGNEEHFKGETLCLELSADGRTWEGAERREMNVDGEDVVVVLARHAH